MTPPTLLFGAFDRHNFGDLLFPHVAAALLPGRPLIFAGLAARDMRPWGGHPVRALAELAAELRAEPLHLVHVGGELLSCSAWQAAVMLQTPDAAPAIIRRLDARPADRQAWAEAQLGFAAEAPYCIPPRLFPAARRIVYCGVGGVDLADQPSVLRDEVLARLRAADAIGVRDRLTLAGLARAGIPATLMPDPAVLVAELFGPAIAAHGRLGEVADIRREAAQGYLAVQIAADFGDDATLAALASQLDRAASASGDGIALFRAGAAPWHDDRECLRRLAGRLRTRPLRTLESLHLWDICALIAGSRAYCGSSLHGRIVATAFGLPRINLLHPSQVGQWTKQAAFATTWDAPDEPGAVLIAELADGLARSFAVSPARRRLDAADFAGRCRAAFYALHA